MLNARFGENEGLCPMVRVVGYADEGSGQNSTSVPLFEIVKWVPRPACLAEDAPTIAAEAPGQTPKPAPATAMSTDPF
jgi:hypothetical protein